jgi:hypothetical protein
MSLRLLEYNANDAIFILIKCGLLERNHKTGRNRIFEVLMEFKDLYLLEYDPL